MSLVKADSTIIVSLGGLRGGSGKVPTTTGLVTAEDAFANILMSGKPPVTLAEDCTVK